MENFEELKVWQEAHKLVLEIYEITKDFPKEERFRLTDQLCRAAISIPSNIVEGQSKNTTKEYLQSLYIARGSVAETKYHLLLAKDLKFLKFEDYREIIEGYNKVGKMLNGLISALKRKEKNG
ncbi:MAG: four helix bundle protein [candidate division WOR-3 bacterium]